MLILGCSCLHYAVPKMAPYANYACFSTRWIGEKTEYEAMNFSESGSVVSGIINLLPILHCT
uniref:Uncharacterized protein n=1 Tax=Arundo donax TaxID=35708 RepID=A0A0A9H8Q4_ARUDO